MKKNFLTIVVVTFVLSLSSCKSSSSFDNDVRKMADFQCRAQKLMAKDPTDEKAKKDLEDLQKEMELYGAKMTEKYKDKKDDKEMETKAMVIMKEEMAKCK
ncbi:MAG: hypothetical protein ABIU11_03030 [Chitinophagaceae bacterium]